MKVHAVKDHSGKIVGTFEDSRYGLSIQPVLKDGEKVEEMEVSSNYREDPRQLYKG